MSIDALRALASRLKIAEDEVLRCARELVWRVVGLGPREAPPSPDTAREPLE